MMAVRNKWARHLATFVLLAITTSTSPSRAAEASQGDRTPAEARQIVDESLLEQLMQGPTEAIVTVRYADTPGPRSQLAFAARERAVLRLSPGATLTNSLSALPVMTVMLNTPEDALTLAQDPLVQAVGANRAYRLTLVESLPMVGQPAVASRGFSGAGTAVAVIDTGVDYHADAFGACANAGTPGCKVAYARDFTPTDDGQVDTGKFHGTNVAGIVLGVAPSTKILSLDVYDQGLEEADESDILDAINWAVANKSTYGTVAMNISLGEGRYSKSTCADGSHFTAFRASFAAARSAGIMPVVSSGNSATRDSTFRPGLASPACVPGAVSVGAVYDSDLGAGHWRYCADNSTRGDKVTCFSQADASLDLLAPGAMITSVGIEMGGTSQAAPHVAGAAAVLSSITPTATVDAREESLKVAGTRVWDPRIKRDFSRLDVNEAAEALLARRGWLSIDVAGKEDMTGDLLYQPDGRFIVVGTAYKRHERMPGLYLARYNADGTPDLTFAGGKGWTWTDAVKGRGDFAEAGTLQSDGKIIVAGESYYDGSLYMVARFNADGSLDTSFGSNGIVSGSFGGTVYSTGVEDVIVQPDGKVIICGSTDGRAGMDFVVVRLKANGGLDPTFGGNGRVRLDYVNDDDMARSLALAGGGKLLVGGESMIGGDADFAIVRLDASGSIDSSFAGDGWTTTHFGSGDDGIYTLTTLSGGAVIAGGYALIGADADFAIARYTPTGSLDTSFSTDGYVTTDFHLEGDTVTDVTLQPDGKIVAVGVAGSVDEWNPYRFALARYSSSGVPDLSFGAAGKSEAAPYKRESWTAGAAVTADGKILVGGDSYAPYLSSSGNIVIARFGSTGLLDTAFGG